jgi:transglutaminase-like putative cysteine protease
MMYRVTHTTTYAYGTPVDLADHVVHLRPRVLDGQRVVSSSIVATPAAARTTEGLDHFGNRITWLFLDLPHDAFEVTSEAVVEVGFAAPPEPAATPPWEAVVEEARRGGPGAWDAAEFSFASAMSTTEPEVRAYAAESFPPARPILSALLDFNARFTRDFAFRGGVTTISTPITQVLKQRAGVCQDFSHLMIGGLRAMGVPARYVSGYIRTRPPAGQPRRRGVDQSHAWVGAGLGSRHGWVDLDPTNNIVVQNEHVVLGWGRDYGDVSPVRGIILGGGRHSLAVTVDLEPV